MTSEQYIKLRAFKLNPSQITAVSILFESPDEAQKTLDFVRDEYLRDQEKAEQFKTQLREQYGVTMNFQ